MDPTTFLIVMSVITLWLIAGLSAWWTFVQTTGGGVSEYFVWASSNAVWALLLFLTSLIGGPATLFLAVIVSRNFR